MTGATSGGRFAYAMEEVVTQDQITHDASCGHAYAGPITARGNCRDAAVMDRLGTGQDVTMDLAYLRSLRSDPRSAYNRP